MDELAETQFCITWPCFREAGEEDRDQKAKDFDDENKSGKKDRKKKRKKKKQPPPCETCRLGPEGAARGHVRRAALWCCTRCCLVCCSALRVLILLIGVVGICLAAFYILSPGENKSDGARVMRAGLRALGARTRGGPRERPHRPPAAAPSDLSDRGGGNSKLDPFQPATTECGLDCPGGKTGCPGGRPDCPGGGPDGSDCGPGCPGGRAAYLGRNKDGLASSPDIDVVAGPFQVVDSSVIVSPHDTEAHDDQGDPDGASSPDGVNDASDLDGPSSPGDLEEGQSGSDVPNDPED